MDTGYEVAWEDEIDTVSNIYTFQSDANTDNLQITSLSWNCTGSTIAAAYPFTFLCSDRVWVMHDLFTLNHC